MELIVEAHLLIQSHYLRSKVFYFEIFLKIDYYVTMCGANLVREEFEI